MFVTDKSASGPTMDPVTMAELFILLGSADVLLTEAVFEKLAPADRLRDDETMRTKLSTLPERMLPDAVAVVAAKTKESEPPVLVIETSVEPAGSVSVSTTPVAEFGPLFVIVSVYVALVPAVMDDGPVIVKAMSAELAGRLGKKFATAVPQFAVA